MATTFLDTGLIKSIEIVFPFILSWIIMFAILEWKEVLGKSKGVHSMLAFVVAIFVILSPGVSALIRVMAPWFLVMIVFIVFVLMLFQLLGLKTSTLEKLMTGDNQLIWWIVTISALIFLSALGSVFFNQPAASSTGGEVGEVGEGALFNTFFHPKVLGMIFIFIIGTFCIVLLSGRAM